MEIKKGLVEGKEKTYQGRRKKRGAGRSHQRSCWGKPRAWRKKLTQRGGRQKSTTGLDKNGKAAKAARGGWRGIKTQQDEKD